MCSAFANEMKTLWELRHGLLLLVGFGVFCAAAVNFPWILAIPVILILMSLPIPKIRRSQALKKRGYFLIWGGRGPFLIRGVDDCWSANCRTPFRMDGGWQDRVIYSDQGRMGIEGA